jgi:hypothetical protein
MRRILTPLIASALLLAGCAAGPTGTGADDARGGVGTEAPDATGTGDGSGAGDGDGTGPGA